MKSVIATVTSKGQVTVPVEIRKHLGIQQGSRLVFVLDDEGHVLLEVPKYPSVASLRGVAGVIPQPIPWAQVHAIIREERATSSLPHPETPDREATVPHSPEERC